MLIRWTAGGLPALRASAPVCALAVAVTYGIVAPARPPAESGAAPASAVTLRPDRPSAGELDRRIAAAARQLEVLVEQYNDSREDLRHTVAQSRQLDSQLTPMAQHLRQRQTEIGGLVAETYQRTRSGPAIALLAARTPHQFVDRLLVLNQIASEQRQAVTNLQHARERVADAQRTLAALAAQQRRQQSELATRQAAVHGEIAALQSMRQAAYGGGSRLSDSVDLPAPPYVPGPAGAAVAFAYRQLGKPYRWGAAGPGSYDCSGLTLAAWSRAGVALPHNARRQYAAMAHVSRDDLRPGDLIFYYGGISHVAIYVGDGMMIHAPEYGEDVRVDRYDSQPIHGFGRPSG